MKKVKCNTGELSGLTYGNVYDVIGENKTYEWYYVENDRGDKESYHKSHFTEVNDIEVGSEWVGLNNEEEVKVDYVSDHIVVYGNGEYNASPHLFTSWYKPKPKTVTMYFYEEIGGDYFARSYKLQCTPIAFTREIELP